LERLHSQAERTILVNEICIINRRGIQPEYIDNGEIAVVNSKNILENGLDYENFSSTSSHLWKENPNAHIEKDDILIYTTGANIGRTAIYKKTLPAIASNHEMLINKVVFFASEVAAIVVYYTQISWFFTKFYGFKNFQFKNFLKIKNISTKKEGICKKVSKYTSNKNSSIDLYNS